MAYEGDFERGRADFRTAFDLPGEQPQERSGQSLTPEEKDALYKRVSDWAHAARLIPGGNPGVVTVPGKDEFYNPTGLVLRPDQVDPTTQAFGRLVQQHPEGIPTVAGTNLVGLESGRGYRYRGVPLSPEELASVQSGDLGAARQLAQRSAPGWEARPLSGMQKFAHDYYAPFLAAVGTLGAGAAAGPAVGAGAGAFAAGAQSRFKNPGAIALGAGGGALGGWGGGQLANALGAGPVAAGAIKGATTGAGQALGTEAGQGQFDPAAIGRAGAIGAAGGAATSGAGQLGAGSFSPVAGNVARTAAGTVLPRPAPRRSLYLQPRFAPRDEMNDSLARWLFRNQPREGGR